MTSSGLSDERIPASAVDDLLRTVRLGLAELEVELQQANADVVECEGRLASLVDLPTDDRVAAARTAIESAAVGSHEQLGRALAAAHAHAAARVAAAEAEGHWLVQEAREEVARDLVGPLRLAEPLPESAAPAELALPAPASLTAWVTPPVEAPVPQPTPTTVTTAEPEPEPVAPTLVLPAAGPDDGTERSFWSEADAAAPRTGGVDVLLTAVSALLVLAILTILLLWIG